MKYPKPYLLKGDYTSRISSSEPGCKKGLSFRGSRAYSGHTLSERD